jgi:hypothetical protein
MAFNVYEWRRNQLLIENQYYGDITGENSKGVLQALLKGLEKEKNPTPEEIKQIERLKGEIAKLNEDEDSSSVITKKIKDLTWEDVDGLALPTNSAGTLASMRVTKDLDSWKSKFKDDEAEMEVTIDRKATPWFNQVKIEKLIQSDPMGFQANIDAEKGKPTPD